VARVRPGRAASTDPNFIGFDKYRRAGAYHWKELERSADYRAKAEFVVDRVELGADVLDIGCGDGAYMSRVAAKAGHVVGIDADTEAVRLATKMLRRNGSANAVAHQMPISQLSLSSLTRDRPFDLVYSMDVIEHLPDPTEMLDRIVGVAKPGATVIIGTPQNLGPDLVSPYHVREFGADEFLSLMSPFLTDATLHLLPMKRTDEVVHEDGFLVVVGVVAA
jgi:2-polyprenyl-3-methyl-5-hydroxy-6-metoxy-1,4-benzoquinol methylase